MQSERWRLIWQDEFDGPSGTPPDPYKWGFELGGEGWGNSEWEYYTADNAVLDGEGCLVITAREVTPEQAQSLSCWYGPCRFTSARILTRDRFAVTYGRVEARMKVPYGQGIWPAFWMLGSNYPTIGWPECGEIDIMEHIGREPTLIHGTVHGPSYCGAEGIGGPAELTAGEPFRESFHVFAVEWEREEIRWFLNGRNYFTLTPQRLPTGARWVFDHPFFLILNLAVGGGWPGYPDKSTVFPQELRVDYVRVYQSAE